jgi:transcriptional antiterminator RfaH
MLWPETLLEGSSEGQGQWWVLHVKPRAEKSLARKCFKARTCFFLPQYLRERRPDRRGKDSYLPLFPGYLFLRGSERDRLVALETNLVVSVLSVPNQRELVEDLKRIQRLVDSGLPVFPAEKLEPGTLVAIVEGPLAGLEGTVIRRKNKMTLTLKVSFLQQGASVEMEDWMVEPILDRRGLVGP